MPGDPSSASISQPAQTRPPARGWSGALHSALGLALGGFAFAHAFANYAALGPADAWLDHALARSMSSALAFGVLAALVAHGLLGLYRVARHAQSGATRSSGTAFQVVTGLLVLGFCAYHVITLWPAGAAPHASVRDPYAWLWQRAGEPLIMCVYVLGVCALGFHFGHGLVRMSDRAPARGARLVGRALGGVLGFVLLFAFVQIVARFALGEALIPALS